MNRLDDIAASGNRSLRRGSENGEGAIRCADGFTLSVIAGEGTYCKPRPGDLPYLGDVDSDYSGPYEGVEVGFPSERPEPWDEWARYAENAEDPTETVYGYVPVETVRALVEAHGGEA